MADEKRPAHRAFEQTLLDLRELRRKGFYGTVQLRFQAGEIAVIDLLHTIKPGEPMPDIRPALRVVE